MPTKKKLEEITSRRLGFQINLSPEEKEVITTAANKEGIPIATYIRIKALAAAQPESVS